MQTLGINHVQLQERLAFLRAPPSACQTRSAPQRKRAIFPDHAGHRLAPWLGHHSLAAADQATIADPWWDHAASPQTKSSWWPERRLNGQKGALFRRCAVSETPPAGAKIGDRFAAFAASPPTNDWASRLLAAVNRVAAATATRTEREPDNAGLRRKPELFEYEEIFPPPATPAQEFDIWTASWTWTRSNRL